MKSTNDNLPTNRHSIKAGVMGVRWLRAVASFILLKTKKGRDFLLELFAFAFIVINFFPSIGFTYAFFQRNIAIRFDVLFKGRSCIRFSFVKFSFFRRTYAF
jgi:hypothetical protein